jgi:DNA-binding NtrC family response regulator
MTLEEVKGKRILIVEDDALLAIDMSQHLERAGYSIMGPAGTAAKALDLLGAPRCDAAILDVHLGREETSEPVALELRSGGIPFVIVTAYSHEHLPEAYSGFAILAKPVRLPDVIAEVWRCLEISKDSG